MKELNVSNIKQNSIYLEKISNSVDTVTFANTYQSALELSDKSIRSYMMLYNVVRSTEFAYQKFTKSKDPDIMKIGMIKDKLVQEEDEQIKRYLNDYILGQAEDFQDMIVDFENNFNDILRSISELEDVYDLLMLLYTGDVDVPYVAKSLNKIALHHKMLLRMKNLTEEFEYYTNGKDYDYSIGRPYLKGIEIYCVLIETWQEICEGLVDYVDAILRLL